MDRIIISIAGGLALGSTLAMVSLGLVLAFRSTHTFNFAHGELMVLPAFIVGRWQAERSATALLTPLLVAIVINAAIGVLFFRVVLRRLVGMPVFMPVIATLGLAAILQACVTLEFGYRQYTLDLGFVPSGVFEVGGARLSQASVFLTGLSLAVSALVAILLKFTHIGTLMRAAGQDPLLASQGGIRVHRMYSASWALAPTLAALAGVTYASQNVVSSSLAAAGLLAFPATLLGGLDSIVGAIVGGLVVGLVQGFTATYIGGGEVEVVTYVILLAVLMFKPHGIFGAQQVSRL